MIFPDVQKYTVRKECMLSDLKIRRAKCPKDKRQIKITDGRGLYLLVLDSDGKYWRYDYRYNNKRKTLALGVYPKVSLAEARHLHADASHSLEQGIDPKLTLHQSKSHDILFQDLYQEWFQNREGQVVQKTLQNIQSRMSRLVLPSIGAIPINQLDSPTVLSVLRQVQSRGTIHTAHRIKSLISQVMRYAIATGKATNDPTIALRNVLKSDKPTARAAILDPRKLADLMRSIDEYTGSPSILHALQILPQVFVRPGELRWATWVEIDWDEKIWRIPEERMKMKGRGAHIVPLSSQVLHILRTQKECFPDAEFVFPGLRPKRPLSENTLNMALRSLGYDGNTQVAHGFRATARSLLAEHGWPIAAIERQLAHAEKDRIAQAYARAEYLEIRSEMMQAWSNYFDALKEGKTTELTCRFNS